MVYPYNGILFSHKKKWSPDTCYNMDETWKYDAKWNKPDTKGQIIVGFQLQVSRIGKFIETKSR